MKKIQLFTGILLRLKHEAKFQPIRSRHYPDLGSDASSVWNFRTHSTDFISWGNQWWLCALLAVLSGELRSRSGRIDFALPLLLAIQTTYFSLDRTRHSHKRNQKTVFTGSSCCTLLIKTLTLTSSPVKTSFQQKHRAVASSCLVLILAFFWKKSLIEKIIPRKKLGWLR